jgi:hypothetical protein
MKCTVIATLSLFALALSSSPAVGDVIFLRNGQQLEGEILPLANGKVRVRLASGSLTLSEHQIAEVRDARTPEEIALETLEELDADGSAPADRVVELAQWAEEQQAFTLARRLYREALRRDPDQRMARRALGFHHHEDQWLTEEEFRTARNEVSFRGRWVSAATRDEVLKAEALAATRSQQPSERGDRRRDLAPEPSRRTEEERWVSAFEPVAVVHPYAYARSAYGYGYSQPLAPFRIGQIQIAHPGHNLFLRPLRVGAHHPHGRHAAPRSRYTLSYPNQGVQRIGIGVIGGPR